MSCRCRLVVLARSSSARPYWGNPNVLSDPELSIGGKFFVGATGSGLMIVISAPLVLWGFNVAVLGTSNGN